MVVFEGMRLPVIGVVLGVAGALALTPLMTSLLYGVQPSNPAVLTLVAILLSTSLYLRPTSPLVGPREWTPHWHCAGNSCSDEDPGSHH